MGEERFRVLVVIPVYNEENGIRTVLQRFKGITVDKILVINDGSTDSTGEVIRRFPAEIIKHLEKQGVGSCIRDGIDHAIENHYDIAVIMAGNGKDDPREIPLLLKPIIQEDCDYVQGSRYLKGGKAENTPLVRAVGIRALTFLWSVLLRRKLTDITNGFRAYKISLFENPEINIRQEWLSGYELEYYIHFWVLKLGYMFKEVPVSKIYPAKKDYSKIRPFVDWWSIIKPLFYLSLRIRE